MLLVRLRPARQLYRTPLQKTEMTRAMALKMAAVQKVRKVKRAETVQQRIEAMIMLGNVISAKQRRAGDIQLRALSAALARPPKTFWERLFDL